MSKQNGKAEGFYCFFDTLSMLAMLPPEECGEVIQAANNNRLYGEAAPDTFNARQMMLFENLVDRINESIEHNIFERYRGKWGQWLASMPGYTTASPEKQAEIKAQNPVENYIAAGAPIVYTGPLTPGTTEENIARDEAKSLNERINGKDFNK